MKRRLPSEYQFWRITQRDRKADSNVWQQPARGYLFKVNQHAPSSVREADGNYLKMQTRESLIIGRTSPTYDDMLKI